MKRFPRCTTRGISTITETANKLFKVNCQLAHFTHSSRYEDALYMFDQIRHHLKPDQYTLSSTVTACANLRDITFGNKLHAHAIKSRLKAYPHVANTLLSLYTKVGDLASVKHVFDEIETPDAYSWTTLLCACTKLGDIAYACVVFDKMTTKDVAVWNVMITGCVENGCEDTGIFLFREMHLLGVRHDNYSFASVFSACSLELEDFGRQVHSLVIKTGFLAKPSVVNALSTMYFNCKNIADACLVFEEAKALALDQITFNVIIDGLVSVGRFEEALMMFREMLDFCLRPTDMTFLSLISSCSCIRVGCQFHALATKSGFEACTSVSNATITMYSRFGDFHAANMVFVRLEEKDLVSWNSMIASYAHRNFHRSAMLVYLDMQRAGVEPDEFTFGSLLASAEFIETVKMIQALVFRKGLMTNIQVSNALISAYSKHGNMKQAYEIFHDLSPRNLISWNAIISGFMLNGLPMRSLEQFSELLMSELRPDIYTSSIILSLCASISSLRYGKQVHCYILRHVFSLTLPLGNALITMYASCGVLNWSLRVFNKMTERDVGSWNSLISAYAKHGQGKEALHCFEVMQHSYEVKPDQATFSAILSACSHAGLVYDGTRIFNSMAESYGICPGVDHFSCIVDLLGRAGCFDEVERIINSEHFEAHPNIWWTLFSACVTHGNLRLGRLAAGYLIETEKDNPSVYVLLSNIYAAASRWEQAANVRKLMENNRVLKQHGCSWIGP